MLNTVNISLLYTVMGRKVYVQRKCHLNNSSFTYILQWDF